MKCIHCENEAFYTIGSTSFCWNHYWGPPDDQKIDIDHKFQFEGKVYHAKIKYDVVHDPDNRTEPKLINVLPLTVTGG